MNKKQRADEHKMSFQEVKVSDSTQVQNSILLGRNNEGATQILKYFIATLICIPLIKAGLKGLQLSSKAPATIACLK
eukprot:5503713-Ditylum_brightwellii.AAC.1